MKTVIKVFIGIMVIIIVAMSVVMCQAIIIHKPPLLIFIGVHAILYGVALTVVTIIKVKRETDNGSFTVREGKTEPFDRHKLPW